MRFKPFNIIPCIISDYVPPREDRNVGVVKSPVCESCPNTVKLPDFTPIIYNGADNEWQCMTCWHLNNSEIISANMIEKIDEAVKGIKLTILMRDSLSKVV